MATTRKIEALRQTALRGGSAQEREFAAQCLRELGVTIPPPEEKVTVTIHRDEDADKWLAEGVLTRHRKGAKAYLRGSALSHFLKHIPEGKRFTYKTAPYGTGYGSADFYVIMSFLLKFKLANKVGAGYYVPSKDRVKAAFNTVVDKMKL